MSTIKTKTIPKAAHNLIRKVEKKLSGVGDVYLDSTINNRIEREISHLGKENLSADHVYNLSKKFNKKNKNKVLFLLVKLFNFNKQVNESLTKELKNDKKLLNKRIKTKIDKNKVHKDIYKKLLKIANEHFKVVENYAKTFNPKKKYSRRFILNIVYHKRKAEAIYKELTNVKMRRTLHRVLLTKLDRVFQTLIDFTVELANKISQIVKAIQNNNVKNMSKKTKEIQTIVSDKIGVLRDFAYKYSYNVIHSDHFFDFDNNKIILVTKRL